MKRRGLTIREMRTLDAAHNAIQSAALAVKAGAEAVQVAAAAMEQARPKRSEPPSKVGFEAVQEGGD